MHPGPLPSDQNRLKRRTVASPQQLRRAGPVVTLASLAIIALTTLLPEPGKATAGHLCVICGAYGGVDALLNVLLYVPLGLGLYLCGFRFRYCFFAAFALSALVETAQLLAISGRDATIGDVLANTAGAVAGFGIGVAGRTFVSPEPRRALILAGAWTFCCLAWQIASSRALTPSFPQSRYYGEIAPQLSNYAMFEGRVRFPRIGQIPIPDFAFSDSRPVRILLMGGTQITAVIVPGPPTSNVAPIVRIADSKQREVMLLGQKGNGLVFSIRFLAAAWKLRRPMFLWDESLPKIQTDSLGDAVIRASASYRLGVARIAMAQSGEEKERQMPLSPLLGWTLILPFQWYVQGNGVEQLVTAIWVCLLAFPLGYWLALSAPASDRQRRISWAAAVFVEVWVFFIAIGYIPLAFGFQAESMGTLIITAGGFLAGVGLALTTRLARKP